MRKVAFILILFSCCILHTTVDYAQLSIIINFAGDSLGGYGGDGGLADTAKLKTPSGVATDRHGNVFIADQVSNTIRKVNAAGIISTVAGNDTLGYSGDNGPATLARLSNPTGVAVDKHGNVYIADQYNNVIRKVDTNNIITTIAGNDTLGFGGDSGLAIHAMLWHPADVATDTLGNIYIVDQDNSRIRKVDTLGIITTFAGIGTAGFGGDSGLAINAKLNFPQGIAVDKYGNVYIADFYNSRIRKVDTGGYITTVAGNGTGGYSGDDSLAVLAEIYDASAVAVDDSGNIYISDYYNDRIRKVNTSGIITTIAGNGIQGYAGDNGPAVLAEIFWPEGVAVDSSGRVYIADYGNHVVREIKKADSTTATKTIEHYFLKVAPNPSPGQFMITTDYLPQDYSVEVCNIMGEKVYQSTFKTSSTLIDLSGEPSGIYLLYLRSAKGISIEKLLVCH